MIKKIIMMALIVGVVGCDADNDGRPLVVSTTGMLHHAVTTIGEDHIRAVALMGPGVDPHLYRASAGDIQTLNRADLIVYNGLHLEAKLIPVFQEIAKKTSVRAVAEAIPVDQLVSSEDFDGFYDPHVWFDVSLWQYVVASVTEALIEMAPQHTESFKKNEARYRKELDELDHWIKHQINQIPVDRRYLITAHDAFQYFSRRYGIQVIGLQGISTAAQANTSAIQSMTRTIIRHNIPTIFIESSVPVRQIEAVKAAVNAKGYEVTIGTPLFTDAMGSEDTLEGTYPGMIRHNVLSIVEGLKE